jgi:hypothetical protein
MGVVSNDRSLRLDGGQARAVVQTPLRAEPIYNIV